MLYNYESTLQNAASLYTELLFLLCSLHYYDNTFISTVVASAVFSTEKLLQHWDNSSFVEFVRQSLHLSGEINRKKACTGSASVRWRLKGWLSMRSMRILMQKNCALGVWNIGLHSFKLVLFQDFVYWMTRTIRVYCSRGLQELSDTLKHRLR